MYYTIEYTLLLKLSIVDKIAFLQFMKTPSISFVATI